MLEKKSKIQKGDYMRNPSNEAAIRLLLFHIDRCYFEPYGKWPREELQYRSYERAAAYEILQILLDHPEDEPAWLIEDFYNKVSYYWASAPEDSKQSEMFSTAIIVADDILQNIIYLI